MGAAGQPGFPFTINMFDSLRVGCLVIPVKFKWLDTEKFNSPVSRSCGWKIIVLIGSVQDVYENQFLGTTTPVNLSFCPFSQQCDTRNQRGASSLYSDCLFVF